jgi:hypothetical protein
MASTWTFERLQLAGAGDAAGLTSLPANPHAAHDHNELARHGHLR